MDKKDNASVNWWKNKPRTGTSRTGLQFSVGRIYCHLRLGIYAKRIGTGALVLKASAIEYIVAKILELAGNAARDNKKKRVVSRHIQLAVRKKLKDEFADANFQLESCKRLVKNK